MGMPILRTEYLNQSGGNIDRVPPFTSLSERDGLRRGGDWSLRVLTITIFMIVIMVLTLMIIHQNYHTKLGYEAQNSSV